jgi:hypothetical protein
MIVGVAAPANADSDAKVCDTTAKTVTDHLGVFIADMQDVSARASNGDRAGAEQKVKHAGHELVALGGDLRQDAQRAETPRLRQTVQRMASEFDQLGRSLTDLESLQRFDTTELDGLAGTMSRMCGGPSTTPGAPSPTPGAPSPTPGRPSPGPLSPAPPGGSRAPTPVITA